MKRHLARAIAVGLKTPVCYWVEAHLWRGGLHQDSFEVRAWAENYAAHLRTDSAYRVVKVVPQF